MIYHFKNLGEAQEGQTNSSRKSAEATVAPPKAYNQDDQKLIRLSALDFEELIDSIRVV